MKKISISALAIGLVAATFAQADVVIKPVNDNIGGALYGGLSGLMIGGAAGGPLGALVGAGVGVFVGDGVQDATGLSQRAYLIEKDDGREVVVRSPNYAFEPNDRVQHVSDRLLPIN